MKSATVTFILQLEEKRQPGEARKIPAVSGSIPELGCWDVRRAAPSKKLGGRTDLWVVSVQVPWYSQFSWQWVLLISNQATRYGDMTVASTTHSEMLQVFRMNLEVFTVFHPPGPSKVRPDIAHIKLSTTMHIGSELTVALMGSSQSMGEWDPQRYCPANENPLGSGNWSVVVAVGRQVEEEWKWVLAERIHTCIESPPSPSTSQTTTPMLMNGYLGTIVRWEGGTNRMLYAERDWVELYAPWEQPAVLTWSEDLDTQRFHRMSGLGADLDRDQRWGEHLNTTISFATIWKSFSDSQNCGLMSASFQEDLSSPFSFTEAMHPEIKLTMSDMQESQNFGLKSLSYGQVFSQLSDDEAVQMWTYSKDHHKLLTLQGQYGEDDQDTVGHGLHGHADTSFHRGTMKMTSCHGTAPSQLPTGLDSPTFCVHSLRPTRSCCDIMRPKKHCQCLDGAADLQKASDWWSGRRQLEDAWGYMQPNSVFTHHGATDLQKASDWWSAKRQWEDAWGYMQPHSLSTHYGDDYLSRIGDVVNISASTQANQIPAPSGKLQEEDDYSSEEAATAGARSPEASSTRVLQAEKQVSGGKSHLDKAPCKRQKLENCSTASNDYQDDIMGDGRYRAISEKRITVHDHLLGNGDKAHKTVKTSQKQPPCKISEIFKSEKSYPDAEKVFTSRSDSEWPVSSSSGPAMSHDALSEPRVYNVSHPAVEYETADLESGVLMPENLSGKMVLSNTLPDTIQLSSTHKNSSGCMEGVSRILPKNTQILSPSTVKMPDVKITQDKVLLLQQQREEKAEALPSSTANPMQTRKGADILLAHVTATQAKALDSAAYGSQEHSPATVTTDKDCSNPLNKENTTADAGIRTKHPSSLMFDVSSLPKASDIVPKINALPPKPSFPQASPNSDKTNLVGKENSSNVFNKSSAPQRTDSPGKQGSLGKVNSIDHQTTVGKQSTNLTQQPVALIGVYPRQKPLDISEPTPKQTDLSFINSPNFKMLDPVEVLSWERSTEMINMANQTTAAALKNKVETAPPTVQLPTLHNTVIRENTIKAECKTVAGEGQDNLKNISESKGKYSMEKMKWHKLTGIKLLESVRKQKQESTQSEQQKLPPPPASGSSQWSPIGMSSLPADPDFLSGVNMLSPSKLLKVPVTGQRDRYAKVVLASGQPPQAPQHFMDDFIPGKGTKEISPLSKQSPISSSLLKEPVDNFNLQDRVVPEKAIPEPSLSTRAHQAKVETSTSSLKPKPSKKFLDAVAEENSSPTGISSPRKDENIEIEKFTQVQPKLPQEKGGTRKFLNTVKHLFGSASPMGSPEKAGKMVDTMSAADPKQRLSIPPNPLDSMPELHSKNHENKASTTSVRSEKVLDIFKKVKSGQSDLADKLEISQVSKEIVGHVDKLNVNTGQAQVQGSTETGSSLGTPLTQSENHREAVLPSSTVVKDSLVPLQNLLNQQGDPNQERAQASSHPSSQSLAITGPSYIMPIPPKCISDRSKTRDHFLSFPKKSLANSDIGPQCTSPGLHKEAESLAEDPEDPATNKEKSSHSPVKPVKQNQVASTSKNQTNQDDWHSGMHQNNHLATLLEEHKDGAAHARSIDKNSSANCNFFSRQYNHSFICTPLSVSKHFAYDPLLIGTHGDKFSDWNFKTWPPFLHSGTKTLSSRLRGIFRERHKTAGLESAVDLYLNAPVTFQRLLNMSVLHRHQLVEFSHQLLSGKETLPRQKRPRRPQGNIKSSMENLHNLLDQILQCQVSAKTGRVCHIQNVGESAVKQINDLNSICSNDFEWMDQQGEFIIETQPSDQRSLQLSCQGCSTKGNGLHDAAEVALSSAKVPRLQLNFTGNDSDVSEEFCTNSYVTDELIRYKDSDTHDNATKVCCLSSTDSQKDVRKSRLLGISPENCFRSENISYLLNDTADPVYHTKEHTESKGVCEEHKHTCASTGVSQNPKNQVDNTGKINGPLQEKVKPAGALHSCIVSQDIKLTSSSQENTCHIASTFATYAASEKETRSSQMNSAHMSYFPEAATDTSHVRKENCRRKKASAPLNSPDNTNIPRHPGHLEGCGSFLQMPESLFESHWAVASAGTTLDAPRAETQMLPTPGWQFWLESLGHMSLCALLLLSGGWHTGQAMGLLTTDGHPSGAELPVQFLHCVVSGATN